MIIGKKNPVMQFLLPPLWQVFLLGIKGSVIPLKFHFILISGVSNLFPELHDNTF